MKNSKTMPPSQSGPTKQQVNAVANTHGGPAKNTGFSKAKHQAASRGGAKGNGGSKTAFPHPKHVAAAKTPSAAPGVTQSGSGANTAVTDQP